MNMLSIVSFSLSKGGAGIAAKKFKALLVDYKSDFKVNIIT